MKLDAETQQWDMQRRWGGVHPQIWSFGKSFQRIWAQKIDNYEMNWANNPDGEMQLRMVALENAGKGKHYGK